MSRFFSRVKAEMRERETAAEIMAIDLAERPVLVYAEDSYSWNQLEGYVRGLLNDHGLRVVYVTSDGADPLLAAAPHGMRVFHIERTIGRFLPSIDSQVFVTTMPDLDQLHVDRPRQSTCVYVFHSLNSTHMAYREGAFDAYDVLFCTGPYQRTELASRFDAIGKRDASLLEVGYYKLDRIRDAWSRRGPATAARTAVVAPSWGNHNLLATCGAALVDSLVSSGFEVIVRPHPAFFESIYPEGQQIVEELANRFTDEDAVRFEYSTTTETSFLDADVMVSDWSGAAFEYAFATERPVLFIDVPPKVKNERWAEIPHVPFEDRMRHEVGEVLAPNDVTGAGDAARTLMEQASAWQATINAAAERELYNVGRAATIGAEAIAQLVEDR